MLKRTLAILLTVFVLGATLAGCAAAPATPDEAANETPAATEEPAAEEPAATPEPAPAGGIFNFNLGSEPPELDPQLSTDVSSFTILNATMEGLVRFDKDGSYMPGAATEWIVSEDGTTYTFTLRQENYWSNGTPVTAADFVFALQRAVDPVTASQYAYILYDIKNAKAVNEGTMTVDQLGVRAEGDYTLVIELEQPTAYFLSIAAFGTALPTNQAFFEANAEAYASSIDTLIFNGPFLISEWVHESHMTLTKNPNYWNADAISLEQINVFMIADAATAKVKFFNKELDMINVPGADIMEFTDRGFTLQEYADGATFYLQFNNTDPIFINENLRKAFSMALDRQSFITNVLKDKSIPAFGFVNPVLPGLERSFRDESGDHFSDNDVAEAKRLFDLGLSELGITADEATFSIIMDEGDIVRARGAALQEMWRAAFGVEVEVIQVPFAARLQMSTDGDFQMVLSGWGPDYNDPMTFMDLFVTDGGNNNARYSNPAFDKLIEDAKVEANPAVRMQMMLDAEKILMEDLPIAPLWFRVRTWAAHEGIEGVVRRAIGGNPDFYWATKN